MESVTLVGMRPRAVGNPIENLCSVVGAAGEGSLDANRLPSLATAAGVAAGKPPPANPAAAGTKVQPLYDDQHDSVEHRLQKHADFEHADIMSQNQMIKQAAPTRLPAIQNGTASKTDLSGVAMKRSATSGSAPMSPETAMKLFMHKLSPFEQHEIFDYAKVRPHLSDFRMLGLPINKLGVSKSWTRQLVDRMICGLVSSPAANL